jgi:hypothetical protein
VLRSKVNTKAMGCFGDAEVAPDGKPTKEARPSMGQGRNCTDVFWLVLFVVFWAGMVAIAYLSLTQGTPDRLIYGTDSWGNICGRDNPVPLVASNNSGLNMTDRPSVFYYNPFYEDAVILCVAECPNSTNITSEICLSEPYTALINDTVYAGMSDFNIDADGCPESLASSYVEVFHRCIPVDLSRLEEAASVLSNTQIISTIINDLSTSWKDLLYVSAIAFGIALFSIFFMGFLARILIWTTYFACIAGLATFIGYMWYTWKTLSDEYYALPQNYRLQSQKDNIEFYYKGGIIVSVIAGLLLLILIAMRNRIALVVAIFVEAGRAIRKMPLLLFMPISTFIFSVAMLGYFIIVYAYLYTIADPVLKSPPGHATYSRDDVFVYM